METVPFEEEKVKAYLDKWIIYWRDQRDNKNTEGARLYVAAFQDVRMALFGKYLE